jgi:2-hydroxymuconate-semialdehyde hydrolase
MQEKSQEIGEEVYAAGIKTNYHDSGKGEPVLLIHGSGPGVSAWANWRLTIPHVSKQFRVIAPDMVGFGFTERPTDYSYNMDAWVAHAINFLDSLELETVSIVGNSFGGALALALTIRFPNRISKLVLMGSCGVDFELTDGLDKTWGYQPSIENMKRLLDIFAYDLSLVTDELAQLRYEASIRPGFQESFEKMFPSPRQNSIKGLESIEKDIRGIDKKTLIIHGREDKVIPLENSYKLFSLISDSQLHVFGQCGHWTQIEYADQFNVLLSNFLAEAS